MEDTNVFFYAALVVIAFISWVVGRIREAMEVYKERQRRAMRQRRGETGEPPTRPSAGQRTNDALRETYRALGIPFPEDEIVVEQPPPPPQVSRQRPSRVAQPNYDLLTTDERKALERIERDKRRQLEARKAPPSRSSTTPPAVVSRQRSNHAIRQALRAPGSLRKAIILKEILDPPKALRSGEEIA